MLCLIIMRTILIIIFSILCSQLVGQTRWTFNSEVRFDRYSEYKGLIGDKYPITMHLEETAKSCNDQGTRWTPRVVYGWYKYDRVGKKIPLVGHVCYADMCETSMKLFVPNDPIEYQFDSDCDVINAKETFYTPQGTSNMVWQMSNGKSLPVKLESTHPYDWKTKAIITLQINGLQISSFDLTSLTKNEYIENVKILSQKRTNGSIHLIFEYYHQSNPGSFGHGMCGAGIEDFIGYLKVNKDFDIEQFDQIQTRSCTKSIDYSDRVIFDKENPELGISKK